jgi:hypothetical protein
MGHIDRAAIEQAIKGATGDPDLGPVRDVTPQIIEAINTLVNGHTDKETRTIKPEETRTTKP